MFDNDPFMFFRFWLGWAVTIYFSIVTWQSLYGWWITLRGRDRYTSLARRYLVLQGLRLRFRTFWGDLIICVLLMVAFLMLWHAQGIMDDITLAMRR